MLPTTRAPWKTLRGSLAAIVGLASVAAAIVSVHMQIGANADEARISRSFSLYEQFTRSAPITDLMTLSGELDARLRAPLETASVESTKIRIAEVNAEVSGPEFYQHMIELLRQSSAIARCIGHRTDRAAGWFAHGATCDQTTIIMLLGEPLVELFFRFRPAIYCDSYIRNFSSDIKLLEELVSSYFRHGGLEVYRRVEDVPPAIGSSAAYVVLEFGPERHCAPFGHGTRTAGLSSGGGSG